MVQRLGWSRVGVLYANEVYGINLAARFRRACVDIGIDVVGAVSFAAGVNLSSLAGKAEVADISAALRQQFGSQRINLYLLAAAGDDVSTAVFAANLSGLVGVGNAVLLSDGAFAKARTPGVHELCSLLDGAVGVHPDFDVESVAAQQMHAHWTSTDSAWTDLMYDFDTWTSAVAVLSPPVFTVADIHPWAYYAWDAAVVAARSVVNAWNECSSGGNELEIHCLLALSKTTVYSGATGDTSLSAGSDSIGAYGVFNLHYGRMVRTGRVLVQANSTQIRMSPEKIVWSDGVSGRSTGPTWGQDPPVTKHTVDPWILTPTGLITVVGLSVGMALALAMWRHVRAERLKRRPQNLRKMIAELQLRVQNSMHESNSAQLLPLPRKTVTFATASPTARPSGGRPSRGDCNLKIPPVISEIDVPAELSRDDVMLSDVIGKGQFGQVSRGQLLTTFGHARVKTTVNVAVKTVQDESTFSTEGAHRKFLEEAIITWQFEHSNIVQMYGVVTAGFPYLMVLEFCSNGSLLNYVARHTTDHTTAHLLGILRDIAAGMAYLVSRSFVHRDLAARNVLLDEKHRAKICDFGLGRNLQSDAYEYRMATDLLLPIRWTDPWALQHQIFSEASDVWSFGVTVIEVFTMGARPYGNWPNLLVLNSVNEGYRHPRPESMPEGVYEGVVLPCWHRMPQDTTTPNFNVQQGFFGVQEEQDNSFESADDTPDPIIERVTFVELATRLTDMCACAASANRAVDCYDASAHANTPQNTYESAHEYEYSTTVTPASR
jgi:serine/threonine protein kinase